MSTTTEAVKAHDSEVALERWASRYGDTDGDAEGRLRAGRYLLRQAGVVSAREAGGIVSLHDAEGEEVVLVDFGDEPAEALAARAVAMLVAAVLDLQS